MCKSLRNSINEDYAKMPDSAHAGLTGIRKLEKREFYKNNFAIAYDHSTYRDTIVEVLRYNQKTLFPS